LREVASKEARPSITLEALMTTYHGDVSVFDSLQTKGENGVSLAEWQTFLIKKQIEKLKRDDVTWLPIFLRPIGLSLKIPLEEIDEALGPMESIEVELSEESTEEARIMGIANAFNLKNRESVMVERREEIEGNPDDGTQAGWMAWSHGCEKRHNAGLEQWMTTWPESCNDLELSWLRRAASQGGEESVNLVGEIRDWAKLSLVRYKEHLKQCQGLLAAVKANLLSAKS